VNPPDVHDFNPVIAGRFRDGSDVFPLDKTGSMLQILYVLKEIWVIVSTHPGGAYPNTPDRHETKTPIPAPQRFCRRP
jgi:hypothetical protein